MSRKPQEEHNAAQIVIDEPGQSVMRYSDLARYLQISQTKLRHDVMMGIIPYVKIGSCVRFVKADIDNWLKKKSITSEESHE